MCRSLCRSAARANTFRHGFIGRARGGRGVAVASHRVAHPPLERATKKYALDNFFFFFFFFWWPFFLPESSAIPRRTFLRTRVIAIVTTRGRGRGHASDVRPRRFWKIKFIALVASQPLRIMACPLENVKSITSLLVDFDVIFMVPRQLNVSANTMMGIRVFRGKIYDLLQPCITRTVTKGNYEIPLFQQIFRLSISACRRYVPMIFFFIVVDSISNIAKRFQPFLLDLDDYFCQSAFVC